MIRTLAARLLFALAAACALAASTGVAVPPHNEEPGTPDGHDHVLAAYRFGFLVPAVDHQYELSPAMLKLHRVLAEAGVPAAAAWQMPGMVGLKRPLSLPTFKTAGLSPIQDLAIEFALLAILVPRLARPTRRAVAELPRPPVPSSLWQTTPRIVPPRVPLFVRPTA